MILCHRPLSLCSLLAWSDNIDGGGWTLVRRVKQGTNWHPARDHLRGEEEYGTPGDETADETFSIRFDSTEFNEFLFASGTYVSY